MKNIKSTSLYLFLLNIYRFRHCFKNIGNEFGCWNIFILLFYNLIGMRDKEIYIKNLNLYVKANFFVVTTLIEIFNKKLYSHLHGYDSVLDLGAYIGESAIYLKRYNKQVICFEPSPEKFKLLSKNIRGVDGISGYNLAVVDDPYVKELVFHQRSGFDFCSGVDKLKRLTKQEVVECTDIQSVLSENFFDAIKMDIEGGEFPILEYIMKQDKFSFLGGVIEFHFCGEEVENKIIIYNAFIRFLKQKGFTLRVFDNDNRNIVEEDYPNIGKSNNLGCINLEFIKK